MKRDTIMLNGRETDVIRWEASEKRAKVIIVHGLGEHVARYDAISEDFTSAGVEMVGFDQRGHGRNPGTKGYVKSFTFFLDDLREFVRNEFSTEISLFMLGHSLGGLIAARYAEEYPNTIDGLILSSGAFTYENVSPFLRFVVKVLSPVLPKMPFSNGIKPETISRNDEIVKDYISDPLVHAKITPRLANEMFKNIDLLFEKVMNLRMPVLMLAGGSDKIVPVTATQKLFKFIPSEDKKLEIFEGAYHEVFCDPQYAVNFRKKVIDWILKQVKRGE